MKGVEEGAREQESLPRARVQARQAQDRGAHQQRGQHPPAQVEVTAQRAEATTRGVVGITDLDLDDAVGAWSRRSGSRVRVEVGVYPHDLDLADRTPAGRSTQEQT